jgi:hypothetical protein
LSASVAVAVAVVATIMLRDIRSGADPEAVEEAVADRDAADRRADREGRRSRTPLAEA